jgi:hypothetical protein
MEAVCISKTSVNLNENTRPYMPEGYRHIRFSFEGEHKRWQHVDELVRCSCGTSRILSLVHGVRVEKTKLVIQSVSVWWCSKYIIKY